MKYLFFCISILLIPFSTYSKSNDSLLNDIKLLLDKKNAPALIYISSHDCISCISYVSQLTQNKCPVLFASDKTEFYDYAKGIGMKIPEDRIVRDPMLIKEIDNQFKFSVAFFDKFGNDTLSASALNASILGICSMHQTLDTKETIQLPKDFDANNLKMLLYLYNPQTNKYQFYNKHYNIVYKIDNESKIRKEFLDINQETQNKYYNEIQDGLKIKKIQLADSSKNMDANHLLRLMGQSKTNLLCFDGKYEMSFLNYCFLRENNDTENYVINKVALMKNISCYEPTTNTDFMFYSLQLDSVLYFVRPYRFKVSENKVAIPFVNVNKEGDVNDSSKINIVIFDLENVKGYLNKPEKIFKTTIDDKNLENIVFVYDTDSLFIFDNQNKSFSIYTTSGHKAEMSYERLGIEYVYDAKVIDKKLFFVSTTSSGYSKLFILEYNKSNIIQAEEKQTLLNNYFDNLRFLDEHKIIGYKLNTNNKYVNCFTFKI